MTKKQIEKYLTSRGWILHKCLGAGWNILNSDGTARQGFKSLSAISEHIQEIQLSPTSLKTVLDLYDHGKADLLDIGIALTDGAGIGEPEQLKRAMAIVERDCKLRSEQT